MKFTKGQQAYLERVIDMEGLDIIEVRGHIQGTVWGDVGDVEGDVCGNVDGDVHGNIWGSVIGGVWGTVAGKEG